MSTKKYTGWPTTRCYPRTMDEAFKHLGCNPEWFYPPEKHPSWGNAIMFIAGIMLWVMLIYWFVKN